MSTLCYEDFIKVHGVLLAASGLPRSLHRKLFEKLNSETFDGGALFQIESIEDGRQRRLVLTAESLPVESEVFLIDHAWTFRLSDAYENLKEIPGLADRMASLMCVNCDTDASDEPDEDTNLENPKLSALEIIEEQFSLKKEKGIDSVKWLELESLNIDDQTLLSLKLHDKFPDLISLSLYGNNLRDPVTVLVEITKFKSLKGLWLNDNPILQKWDKDLESEVIKGLPRLEILNSKFTCNFGKWALGFCCGVYDKDHYDSENIDDRPFNDVTSLDLSCRNIHSLHNEAFSPDEFPHLAHVNIRDNPLEESSSLKLLQLLRTFSCLSSLEVDIPGPLGDSALEILKYLPSISLLNGVTSSAILDGKKHVIDSVLLPRFPQWKLDEPLDDRILNAMWSYLMTYRLASDEKIDETSLWYVMDELGSALRHSDEPNFRVAPFLFMPQGNLESSISYSVLWPVKNVEKGEECTRDFLCGFGEEKQRSARLTAYFHTPKNYFIQTYKNFWQKVQSEALVSSVKLSSTDVTSRTCNNNAVRLRVYTDIPQVQELLNRPEFVLTTEIKDADIIWTSVQIDEEFKKAAGITDHQFINQFPFEASLVMKHHLAETMQKAYGSPDWLQPTYNLESQLSPFIGDYYQREKNTMNNLWILKPWNMARTIDTTVTHSLPSIIRLMETGPKICQKYIEHPALFQGRKFDLRYVVLVRSLNPLQIFLADAFWVRLANNQYTLNEHSFFEYETHFTVMNYRGKINHKDTKEFVEEFELEHNVKWMDVHERVAKMIRSVFEGAVAVKAEMIWEKGRAIYGVDVMLDDMCNPKLLEVTYCPDCTRACTFDFTSLFTGDLIKGPEFYNYVFGCLFLDESIHVTRL